MFFTSTEFFLVAVPSKNPFVLTFCKLSYNFRNFVRCVSGREFFKFNKLFLIVVVYLRVIFMSTEVCFYLM